MKMFCVCWGSVGGSVRGNLFPGQHHYMVDEAVTAGSMIAFHIKMMFTYTKFSVDP